MAASELSSRYPIFLVSTDDHWPGAVISEMLLISGCGLSHKSAEDIVLFLVHPNIHHLMCSTAGDTSWVGPGNEGSIHHPLMLCTLVNVAV